MNCSQFQRLCASQRETLKINVKKQKIKPYDEKNYIKTQLLKTLFEYKTQL